MNLVTILDLIVIALNIITLSIAIPLLFKLSKKH